MFTFVRGIRILSTLGLAALITLGVAHAQGKEPIKIGWLSSLTGPLSSAAIAENKGVEFAVDCTTERENLFVAGEDSGGVHGANRLGGNGVANSTVFGGIAGETMAQALRRPAPQREPDPDALAANDVGRRGHRSRCARPHARGGRLDGTGGRTRRLPDAGRGA